MHARLNLTTLGIALSFPLICYAQGVAPERPEAFAERFVGALRAKNSEQRIALMHPASRACINAQTQPYYDDIFSRQSKYAVTANYKVRVTPVPADGPLMFEDRLYYPLRPTHMIQIDFDTSPYSGASIILQAVYAGARWYEASPCPRPETTPAMQAAKEQRAKQAQRVESLAAQLADPLRAEVVALAKSGRRIDAINKYRDATGEDLTTAKDVVDLLVPR
jgi:hypothetical protein